MDDEIGMQAVVVPRAHAPASVFLGNSIYADFTGEYFKIYVSDGRFAGPPILMSFEDLGQLLNYAFTCKQAMESANNE